MASTLAGAAQAASGDDICRQLQAFETAPFAKGADGKSIRRSVTFRWIGPWMIDAAWRCDRDQADSAAVKLCAYLMDNTSIEFRNNLPMRVMRCYGYRFPKYAAYDWHDWAGSFTLHPPGSDRELELEVDLDSRLDPDAAVRISALPDNADRSKDDADPPPLAPDAPRTKR